MTDPVQDKCKKCPHLMRDHDAAGDCMWDDHTPTNPAEAELDNILEEHLSLPLELHNRVKQALLSWHSQGVGEAEDLRPFDKTIADLEAVRLFLGLQLEECEQKISDTKKARLSRIKNLRSQTPQHTNMEPNSTIAAPQLAVGSGQLGKVSMEPKKLRMRIVVALGGYYRESDGKYLREFGTGRDIKLENFGQEVDAVENLVRYLVTQATERAEVEGALEAISGLGYTAEQSPRFTWHDIQDLKEALRQKLRALTTLETEHDGNKKIL